MRIRREMSNRVVSLLLSLALLLTCMPVGVLHTVAAEADTDSQIVDDHTLDQWKQYFGIQTNHPNDVSLSTEFVGSVWTDKSVFDPSDLPSHLTNAKYNGKSFGVTDEGDNFVVALSAIASNKEIVGYSTIPTDTVLILDLSSSMRSTDDNGGSAVDELVEASNKAITELLALNKNNRVAVVAYAGNTNKQFNNGQGITKVILPLDSYTTRNNTYLKATSNNQALEVSGDVRNSAGNKVSTNNMGISTGTFMQDGIYEGMKVLLGADPVVQSGVQAGTGRLPIMVLMTDGEPTMANPDYNGNDNRTDLGTSTMYSYDGSTGSYSHRDTIAFMTSLTAAFAKKTVADHYDTNALLYTLPYGQSVFTRPEALSVLNPAQASNVQNTLWNSFLDGNRVTVYRSGNQNTYVSNSSAADERLTAADRLYVDKYFPASNDDAMLEAFDAIVDEIVIQSKYYPTYTENDPNHDGYLTFVDKIGDYMEITDIKGVVVGDRLFSGAALAAKFVDGSLGTMDRPTATGDELIRSIMTRLHITNSATAKALAVNAYSHGQLSYKNDQEFSHYLGWFSDADGNYVDFWHEGMTEEQIAEAVSKKGATHLVKSYIFLGDTTVVPGVNNTNMMYMSVRVAREIATDDYMITWQIPASLVPTVTYEVEVEVNSNGEIIRMTDLALESDTADSPMRLVYEVALRTDITDWNMTEKVSADYVQANGYTFWSNKWSADPEDTTLNTYSHFEPSVQNERYYYTQDTEVMVRNGDSYAPYTGSKPSGSGYYHSYQVYEKLENGTLRIHTHYEPISSEAMELVQQDGTRWVIPKDTIHRYYDYEITDKVANTTGTMGHSDHPFVVKSGDIYYTYSTQGNNGKVTVTPATGIKLTKVLADGFTSNADFTFVITGDGTANAQVVRLDENGNEASRSDLPASGELTLKADETVYIVGLTAGNYTVAEKIAAGADYHVSAVAVNGQIVNGINATLNVADQTIQSVEFTNAEQGYGNLVVSKDVNYPEGFSPSAAHNAKTFTVNVTFTGDISAMVAPEGAVKNGNTYTLSLHDGESVTFFNIPEGVTYTVTETDLAAGYTNQAIRYSNEDMTILSATTDQAHVVNAYEPAATHVDLTVQGTKTVTGGWPANASFTLRLWETIDFGSGDIIDTKLTDTVTAGDAAYEIDMSSITFDKEGTYYFRVVEDIPEDRIPDMAYDRTYGLFSVTVTDADADGQLEIASVQNYQNTGLTGNAEDGWVITKDFTNVVTKDIVYLNIQKHVVDAANPNKTYTDHLADITFGLFPSKTADTPSYYILTDGAGKGTIAMPVTKDSLGAEGKVFYLREIAPAVDNRVVGMNYDESWIYALRIKWNDEENVAVTEYATIENGVEGSWTAFDFEQMVFDHTNTYESNVQSTPAIQLSGVKTLNGGNDLGGRKFSFSIYNSTAAFVIQGEPLQTVTNDGNAITFDSIRYSTPGLHYLVVKEDSTDLGGVGIDPVEYHITVLVEKYSDTDNTTRLRVAQGYPTIVRYGASGTVESDALNFNNTYTVTGRTSVTIEGTKTLTGRPMLAGEFKFRLTEVADENGTALEGGLVLEAENGPADDSASFHFAPITYAEEGTHYYKITEVAGEAGTGVTYSMDSFIVKVVVSDNGEGGLTAAKTVVGDRTVIFANSYKASGTYADLLAAKDLKGKSLMDGQFEFTVLQTEQDFVTAVKGGLSKTVSNNARGVIDFGRISYSEEGAYYYVIREKIPAEPAPGFAYDTTEYHITVRVVDNQKGVLESFSSTEMVITDEYGQLVTMPADSVVFYNSYTIAGGATVVIEGSKSLTGRDMQDEEFTFELYKTDDSYAIDGMTPNTTVNIDGEFSFRLDYLPEDVGSTFYYVLQEKNAGKTVDGVTYSNVRYTIQVQVEDNDAGGIRLVVTADGLTASTQDSITTLTGAAFENAYAVSDAELQLTVKKTMTGDKTDPTGFDFGLYAQDVTEALQIVTSDADGEVSFTKLTYSEAGTYTYYIREILPVMGGKTVSVKDNVTYDTTVYKVEVTVSDDGKGNLVATYTVDGADVEEETYQFAFTNSYKEPTVTPETSDDFNLVLYGSLMAVSATALFVLLLDSKKRRYAK